MSQTPTTIGPYLVQRELGRGGMGVVFLAHDTRLDRRVAIKALPEHLAGDAERLARFHREAKLLASLNHPNIAAIFGLEESAGQTFLILEYVDGETLDARLRRGPLPLDESLEIAHRIAAALEAAHEKGVIHRDLKPGNVMIATDGAVKVLDFGLARQADGAVGSATAAARADSPTVVSPGQVHSPTIAGVMLGTVGYMSPEQVRGRSIDARSDIFAFGCVLFELLTGRCAFSGESIADAVGATLHREADLSALPPIAPPSVKRLVQRCLVKDRSRRLQSIADARVELAEAMDPKSVMYAFDGSGAGVASQPRNPAVTVLAAMLLLVLGAAGAWLLAPEAVPASRRPVSRFTIELPEAGGDRERSAIGDVAVSLDGRRIVFEVARFQNSRLFLRDLESTQITELLGTDGAENPVFSPDGRWIAFKQGDALRKVPLDGGSALTICDAGVGQGRMAWLSDGTIVFISTPNNDVCRVSEGGGPPQVLVRAYRPDADAAPANAQHRLSGFNNAWDIGDGVHILVDGWTGQTIEDYEVLLVRLDDGSIRSLVRNASVGTIIEDDVLVFLRGSSLLAVRVNLAEGRTIGPERVVLASLFANEWGDSARMGLSRNGVLAYVPGGRESEGRRIIRVDAAGKATPITAEDAFAGGVEISRDGRRATALTLRRSVALWSADVAQGVLTLLDATEESYSPIWHPDNRHVTFTHQKLDGRTEILQADADSPGTTRLLLPPQATRVFPQSWSPDGAALLLSDTGTDEQPNSNIMIWREGATDVEPLLATAANEDGAAFSPDGKWIAYVSNSTGAEEVYVCPYPDDGRRWRISSAGGASPQWSSDGSQLYFVVETALHSVAIDAKDGFKAGAPQKVLELRGFAVSAWSTFSVAPDDTFIMLAPAAWERNPVTLNVTLNWDVDVRRILDDIR